MKHFLSFAIFLAFAALAAGSGDSGNDTESSGTSVDQTQRARAEDEERARTPDMIPPLAAKPIDDAAIAKAAKIKPQKHCLALGKALRGKDAEFTRAMIQRTAELGLGALKFDQQALIRNEKIQLGMNACMALASWGSPESVNNSVGSFGVHNQWVYPDSYLYFEQGILTSYQN